MSMGDIAALGFGFSFANFILTGFGPDHVGLVSACVAGR